VITSFKIHFVFTPGSMQGDGLKKRKKGLSMTETIKCFAEEQAQ